MTKELSEKSEYLLTQVRGFAQISQKFLEIHCIWSYVATSQ